MSVEYYYSKLKEYVDKQARAEGREPAMKPRDMRILVNMILAACEATGVDPATIDWEHVVAPAVMDFESPVHAYDHLVKMELGVPYDPDAYAIEQESTLKDLVEFIKDRIAEVKKVDPKAVRDIERYIYELTGRMDLLKTREMQLAKVRKEAEKYRWEAEKYKILAESYRGDVERLKQTTETLKKIVDKSMVPIRARPIPAAFTDIVMLKAWESYFWDKFKAELLRSAPEVDPEKFKSVFKDNMEAFYDVLRAGGAVTREEILADIRKKVDEIIAKLKAPPPRRAPTVVPYGLPREYGILATEYDISAREISDKFIEYLRRHGLTYDEYLGLPVNFKIQIDKWFTGWLFEQKEKEEREKRKRD